MGTTLSPAIEPMFLRAGWLAGRSVTVPIMDSCDSIVSPVARRIIREFHGLHVFPKNHAGVVFACSDVRFDLRAAMHEMETCHEWSPHVGSQLFPIGEAGKGYMTLLVDEYERIFEVDLPAGGFCFVGASFVDAMETLLFGHHFRPLVPPGESGVEYSGKWYPAGDPWIYDPK